MFVPLPTEEEERLKQLYMYQVLDTKPEKEFNELVELISDISGCPIAAITFVDKNRQWFKAKKGDSTLETPREISFCAHTILQEAPLIVEDATLDHRFANNPDVIGGLRIRFYAGVPIFSSSRKKLGAVCIIDKQHRSISQELIALLKLISKQVTFLLELGMQNKLLQKYTHEALQNSELAYEYLFEKASEPKWIYECETLRILQVNQAVIKMYGYSKDEFMKMHVYNLRFHDELKNIHQLIQSVKSNDKPSTFETIHQRKDGLLMNVEVSIKDIVYLGRAARIATILDISEKVILKKENRLTDKKIKEIQTKAKKEQRTEIGLELHDNINQILASSKLYLDLAESHEDMRAEMISKSKENILEAIKEVRALSHTLVTSAEDTFNLTQAIQELKESCQIQMQLDLNSRSEDLPEDLKINLFRIVQEQYQNICKHAEATYIAITIDVQEVVTLCIEDDGKGFDTKSKKNGIGLMNIQKRVEYYNGILNINSTIGKGTSLCVTIAFNVDFDY